MYDGRVRWSLPLAGAFGGMVGCAAVLGIEAPSDGVKLDDDAEAASPRGDAAGATDVADAADAGGPAEDAHGPDGELDAGNDDGDDGATPVLGVVCGAETCSHGLGCCFTSRDGPEHCAARSDCPLMNAGGFLGCDGPEDCSGGACCGSAAPGGGGFSTNCASDPTCPGNFTACHPGFGHCATAAGCQRAGNNCLPIDTCGGVCN
jgi:hypothetical protein